MACISRVCDECPRPGCSLSVLVSCSENPTSPERSTPCSEGWLQYNVMRDCHKSSPPAPCGPSPDPPRPHSPHPFLFYKFKTIDGARCPTAQNPWQGWPKWMPYREEGNALRRTGICPTAHESRREGWLDLLSWKWPVQLLIS